MFSCCYFVCPIQLKWHKKFKPSRCTFRCSQHPLLKKSNLEILGLFPRGNWLFSFLSYYHSCLNGNVLVFSAKCGLLFVYVRLFVNCTSSFLLNFIGFKHGHKAILTTASLNDVLGIVCTIPSWADDQGRICKGYNNL